LNSGFGGHRREEYQPPDDDIVSSEIGDAFEKVYVGFKEQYPDKFKTKIRKTIAPGPIPDLSNPAAFIDNLISMKHEAQVQGWITDEGIVRSLDQKLEAAKRKLQARQNRAAANILEAFINEVEAQGCQSYEDKCRGKHLTPEAYALMKYNAKYLVDNMK
jgi:hypothetical protein